MTPNHKQFIDDHFFDGLNAIYGPTAPEDTRNRYSIARIYRTISPNDLKEFISAQLNTRAGTIIIAGVTANYQTAQMNAKKYQATYNILLYLGASPVLVTQLQNNPRGLYQVETDLIDFLLTSPIQLPGNPTIGIRITQNNVLYTDQACDYSQVQITITAIQKPLP